MEHARSTETDVFASGGLYFVYGRDQPITAASPKDWARRGPSARLMAAKTSAVRDSEDLSVKFQRLTAQWKKETKFSSSLHDLVANEAYRQIIGMGEDAVPLILADMQVRPARWFWALSAITGENPIVSNHRGNIVEMTRDWIKWGAGKGLVDEGKG
jgi:hypothetical protein